MKYKQKADSPDGYATVFGEKLEEWIGVYICIQNN